MLHSCLPNLWHWQGRLHFQWRALPSSEDDGWKQPQGCSVAANCWQNHNVCRQGWRWPYFLWRIWGGKIRFSGWQNLNIVHIKLLHALCAFWGAQSCKEIISSLIKMARETRQIPCAHRKAMAQQRAVTCILTNVEGDRAFTTHVLRWAVDATVPIVLYVTKEETGNRLSVLDLSFLWCSNPTRDETLQLYYFKFALSLPTHSQDALASHRKLFLFLFCIDFDVCFTSTSTQAHESPRLAVVVSWPIETEVALTTVLSGLFGEIHGKTEMWHMGNRQKSSDGQKHSAVKWMRNKCGKMRISMNRVLRVTSIMQLHIHV